MIVATDDDLRRAQAALERDAQARKLRTPPVVDPNRPRWIVVLPSDARVLFESPRKEIVRIEAKVSA